MKKGDFRSLSCFFISKLQPIVEAETLLVKVKSQIVVSLVVSFVSIRFNLINKEIEARKFDFPISFKIRVLMEQCMK
jgi:hypothetical protein